MILATARVCRAWKNSEALQAERKEAAKRIEQKLIHKSVQNELKQLPASFTLAFLGTPYRFQRLPELNLNKRVGNKGLIDFLRPQDLSAPVMKFTHPGFALHIEGDNKQGVLSVFRRYPSPLSHWTFTLDPAIQKAIHQDHLLEAEHSPSERCADSPFLAENGVSKKLLHQLLTNNHSIFSLANR